MLTGALKSYANPQLVEYAPQFQSVTTKFVDASEVS